MKSVYSQTPTVDAVHLLIAFAMGLAISFSKLTLWLIGFQQNALASAPHLRDEEMDLEKLFEVVMGCGLMALILAPRKLRQG